MTPVVMAELEGLRQLRGLDHTNRLCTKRMIEFANEASAARIALTVAAALSGAEITQNSTKITTTIPTKRRT